MADESPLPGEPDNVRSISDRAEEEEQIEFPRGVIEVGSESRRTLKNLIRGGLPVEMTVSMMSAEIPLRGGLPDPDGQLRILVTAELHKTEAVVHREEGLVDSWKVRAHLRPIHSEVVEAVASDEAAG